MSDPFTSGLDNGHRFCIHWITDCNTRFEVHTISSIETATRALNIMFYVTDKVKSYRALAKQFARVYFNRPTLTKDVQKFFKCRRNILQNDSVWQKLYKLETIWMERIITASRRSWDVSQNRREEYLISSGWRRAKLVPWRCVRCERE